MPVSWSGFRASPTSSQPDHEPLRASEGKAAAFVASVRHTLYYWIDAGGWSFALVPPEPEPSFPTTVIRTRLAAVADAVLERLG